MTLALYGGKPAVTVPLERFNTIGEAERLSFDLSLNMGPLSGYLGGLPYGGPWVQRLEELWCQKFGVQYAIACNSATSGLLAAASCREPGDFCVSPYTMSATAAAPMFMGHRPVFCDVTTDTFNIATNSEMQKSGMTVVTNLFGHPTQLKEIRALCDGAGALMIEDNAQSPLAMQDGRYAGTIGHIGVFSLNVHKHIQCGEGGVVVTDDRVLADRIRGFINHGEMASVGLGLNLRMTEYTAAIAVSQLNRIDEIVSGRIDQAQKINAALRDISWLELQRPRSNCTHVYYTVPFTIKAEVLGITRKKLVEALHAEGFPLSEGYVAPLYRLPAFEAHARPCPRAEWLHDFGLIYFENCSWTANDEQIEQFGEACRKVSDNIQRLRTS